MSHLVLARRESETIRCIVPPSATETVIEMQVVRCGLMTVRLGFRAPREVVFLRSELGDVKPPTNLTEED